MNYCDIVFEKQGKYLSNIALVDGENGRTYTYQQLQEKVKILGSYLKSLNFPEKSTIATHLYNSAEAVISHLAIQYAGFVSCLLDSLYKPLELLYYLEDCKAVCLLTHLNKPEELSVLPKNIKVIQDHQIESLASTPSDFNILPEPYNFQENEFCSLFYTSGTTSRPKGVMLCPRCFKFIIKIIQMDTYPYIETDKLLDFLPFSHVFACKFIFFSAMITGGTFVILRSFQPHKILNIIDKQNITHIFGVPAHYQQLLRQPDAIPILKKLKVAFSGAAPLKMDTATKWKELVGFYLDEGCGLTETCTLMCIRKNSFPEPLGNVGKPPRLLELQIVDDFGNPVPDGTIGEVVVKGPTVMLGYLNRPEETEKTLRNGCVYTGDYGMKTQDGDLVLHGRKKEFINIAGKKVASFEIEAVLNEHPNIAESAVIGIPDETYGEVAKAYIRLKKEDHSLTERMIIKHCQNSLASFKVPKIVVFVQDFPRNNLGKIDRNQLKLSHLQKS